MESREVMILCSQKLADELIAQDENFKHVVVICPWLDASDANNDSVLVVDKGEWYKLVDAGDVFLRKEIAGVKKHDGEK